MALSDCIECWMTPCECGHEIKNRSKEYKETMTRSVNGFTIKDVFIWLRQGNDGGSSADITGSTGLVGMPARKNPGDPFHAIYGWNYFLSMQVNDYVQIYWSTTSADVSIQYYAASGSPTKPSTQSVVATMTFVSALPT